LQIDRTDSFINLREVSKRLMLPPGRYCIVPCTFGRGEEGEFLLRVFIEKRWGRADGVTGNKLNNTFLHVVAALASDLSLHNNRSLCGDADCIGRMMMKTEAG